MADLARSHHHVHTDRGTGIEARWSGPDRRGKLPDLPNHRRARLFRLLSNGKSRVGLNGVAPPDHRRLSPGAVHRRHREDIHGDESRFEKLLGGLQLPFVPLDGRDSRISRRETVRVDLALAIARVARSHERHVAIGASHGFVGVIEGARALAGDAAGLPIVVIVEPAKPAVIIHRRIQVHLVASGAKLRSRMNGFRNVCRCGCGLR